MRSLAHPSEFKISTENYEIISTDYGYRINFNGEIKCKSLQTFLSDLNRIPRHFIKGFALLIDVTQVVSCDTKCFPSFDAANQILFKKGARRSCFVFKNAAQQILLDIGDEQVVKYPIPRRFISTLAFENWEPRVRNWLLHGTNIE